MDGVTTAFAFLQATETCLKVADTLIQRIKAYRNANDRIAELTIRIEGIWVKTEMQIVALKNTQDLSNKRLQEFHYECIQRLLVKLHSASAGVEDFTGSQIETVSGLTSAFELGPMKKLRYSMIENHLQRTIGDLEAWHAVFDPSWFLMTLHRDDRVDKALQRQAVGGDVQRDIDVVKAIRAAIRTETTTGGSVFRERDFLSSAMKPVLDSSLMISALAQSDVKVVIDTTTYPQEVDRERALIHVRELARVLSCSQPETLGLLQCLGVLKLLDSKGIVLQFQYVFAIPRGLSLNAASLRRLLQESSLSLDAKYRIAKSLTRGVAAVHCSDFVHKNIRPDNILVFSGSTNQDVTAYLVGFERSRPASANTSLVGDMVWERNLYRHPTRQGIRPEHAYLMQHDIYSLGVCLLEIGIWSSLVQPSDPPKPGSLLQVTELLSMTNLSRAAWEIKKILFDTATSMLPSSMGTLYTEVALSCLTCLDTGATNLFSGHDDLYDEDGILVGVAFIEKILSHLQSLSI